MGQSILQVHQVYFKKKQIMGNFMGALISTLSLLCRLHNAKSEQNQKYIN